MEYAVKVCAKSKIPTDGRKEGAITKGKYASILKVIKQSLTKNNAVEFRGDYSNMGQYIARKAKKEFGINIDVTSRKQARGYKFWAELK